MKATTSHYETASFIIRHFAKVLIVALMFFPFIFALALQKAYSQDYVMMPETRSVGRAPASFMPADHVENAPLKKEIWLNQVMVHDDDGVLENMRQEYEHWQIQDEYARNWNLSSTGLYDTPNDQDRVRFFERNFVRYIDRRISGEVRRAEEGSTLHTVGQVQEALRPNTTVEVSPSFRFRFRARILEREATMLVENPWVDADAKVSARGDLELNVQKDFDHGFHARIYYKVDENFYITSIEKRLSDHWRGRLSSTQQDDTVAFTSDADTRFQLLFSQRF